MSAKPMSLRDYLVTSLSTLPNSSDVRIYTITSHPRKTKDLFPHLPNHPRCFQVDYLILCGAGVSPPSSTSSVTPIPTPTHTPNTNGTSQSTPSQDNGINPTPSTPHTNTPFVFTSAISAHLYILPQSASALLYISKVDSSTHGPILPLTRSLIRGFIAYHVQSTTCPAPETRVCLFARSQGQYLFPNSADGGKKTLGGLKLCGWWKGVFEDSARRAVQTTAPQASNGSTNGAPGPSSNDDGEGTPAKLGTLSLEYLLPSYSSTEASGMLGPPKKPLPEGMSWKYTPPFFTSLLSPSSSSSASTSASSAALAALTTPSTQLASLATLIPSLPDDPKTRFLDELVDSTPFHGFPAPSSADQESEEPTNVLLSPRKKRKIQEMRSDEHERIHSFGVLSKTSKEEFWERMGFRQEMAIDVTGFFGIRVMPESPVGSGPTAGEEKEEEKEEREEGSNRNGETKEGQKPMPDPTSAPGAISHQIVERLHQALLNTDFKTLELAIQGSAHWIHTAKTMVTDEIGQEGWELDVGVIPAKEGLAPVERVEKRKEEAPVTMLQVRKKKKV